MIKLESNHNGFIHLVLVAPEGEISKELAAGHETLGHVRDGGEGVFQH